MDEDRRALDFLRRQMDQYLFSSPRIHHLPLSLLIRIPPGKECPHRAGEDISLPSTSPHTPLDSINQDVLLVRSVRDTILSSLLEDSDTPQSMGKC